MKVRGNIPHLLASLFEILDGFVFVLNRIVGYFFLLCKGLSKALYSFSMALLTPMQTVSLLPLS